MSIRNMRDGTIIIQDGSAIPKTLTIPVSEGDFSFTDNENTFIIMNRGRIYGRKLGDESTTQISFTAKFEQWSYAAGASTGISIRDALRGEGGASDWVSTDDACGPFAVDIIFKIADPCNATNFEVLTFENFHAAQINFREGGEFNSLSVSGEALVESPTRTWEMPN